MLFEDLNAFVVVAKFKSFSRAALSLRIAQSSLSKRVQRLEHRFGVTLLQRHGRGVTVTEAGAALVARAERLIVELENVERDVGAVMSEPSGEVRVALPPASSYFLTPLIIEQCEKQFPKIRPKIVEGTAADSHAWLSNRDVDLALMYNPEFGTDFEIQPFLAEPLFAIVPATDFRSGKPIDYPRSYSLKEFARQPLLLPRRPHSIRVLYERLCAGHGIQPEIKYEIDGINALKGMIERGQGVTIFGYAGLKPEIDSGRLKAIPFSTAAMNWKLCLAWPKRDEPFVAMLGLKGIVEKQLEALLRRGFWRGAKRLHDR
jgi:LysR family nitrogen assimilation transcriptional regulator